jgi:hypothetical protein
MIKESPCICPLKIMFFGKQKREVHVHLPLKLSSDIIVMPDFFFPDENETLAPDYIVTREFVDQKIRELVLRYNYTLNPEGIYQAIKYMYTYWPDPNNTYYIREKYIDVSNLINRFLHGSVVCQMTVQTI